MSQVKSAEEFLEEIRALDQRLKNARITNIEINKNERRIKYIFICENVIDEELQKKAWITARNNTSKIFEKVNVYFKKIVSNDELINNEIYKYIKANYPSVSVLLKTTDIRSVVVGDLVKYTVKLTQDGADYMARSGAFNKINEYLGKKFCSGFAGVAEIKEPEETVSLLTEEVYESQLEKINYRTIKVEDVVVIDDIRAENTAVYIEDASYGDVTVCGKITGITERESKNGKPFFVIYLDDTTAKISGIYFSKKNTLNRIRELAEGDTIIVHGNIKDSERGKSFTMDRINRCTFPKDFVKKEKYKKSAPKDYKLIFPEPATTVKVKSVFDKEEPLPKELTEKTYVVFDLETTGLDVIKNNITEIGAVKLVNGKAVEQFTTLIKPDDVITEENTLLTGITEEMVKDAPKITAVLPDFMKFIDGAVLVGHNVEFDIGFVKKYANAEDYAVNNESNDTMLLSRKYLPELKRNKLNDLADYFNITFHHHRALADAYATAEVFVELMKIKSSNENA